MRYLMPVVLAAGAMILSSGAASADCGDQLFKLLPGDGAAEDTFGWSVAVSGTTAIGLSDFADFAFFAGCMSGPGQPVAPGCDPADMNRDGHVDTFDFGLFQDAFAVGCP